MSTKIKNLASQQKTALYEHASGHVWRSIENAFRAKRGASQDISDYRAIYNVQFDENVKYKNTEGGYIPIVKMGIDARVERSMQQLFSNDYIHVAAITHGNEEQPIDHLNILEHYIRTTSMRDHCMALMKEGLVTGQWCLYIDWHDVNVTIVSRKQDDVDSDDDDETETHDFEVKKEGRPFLKVIRVENVAIIPESADSIEECEISCIRHELTKHQVNNMVEVGYFDANAVKSISRGISDSSGNLSSIEQELRDRGIENNRRTDDYEIFEAHFYFTVSGRKGERLYTAYFGKGGVVIGIVECPDWGQRRPMICAGIEKTSGSFYSMSKVASVATLQWATNDVHNLAFNSAMMASGRIIFVDPDKQQNLLGFVFEPNAIWPIAPGAIDTMDPLPLYKDLSAYQQVIQQQIYLGLGINEMMLGVQPAGRKNNALIGGLMQESSVSIIDHCKRFENEVLNKVLERFIEFDAQYRDYELTTIQMGELGEKLRMAQISPIQFEKRYYFKWQGVEFVNSLQRMQQQIAMLNVMRGIPPQLLGGKKLNISPIIQNLVQNVFGNEMFGKILENVVDGYTIDPQTEDEMMINGIPADVHPADDDIQHIETHKMAAQISGDLSGVIRRHILDHMKQLTAKQQQQQQEMGGNGYPGIPASAGNQLGPAAPPGVGVAGTPRPGGQPNIPNGRNGPPGQVGPDDLLGADGRG